MSNYQGEKSSKCRQKAAKARDRTLDDDEIRVIWAVAGTPAAGRFGGVIRLALLTAQRRSKLIAMRHDDLIDFDPEAGTGTWRVPHEGREKSTGGDLVLSSLAIATIVAQPKLAGSPWVFPAYRGRGCLSGIGPAKAAFDRLLPAGMAAFTLHDLRRTARSLMSRAGVNRDIAERVLGHAIGDKTEQTYDRFDYRKQKGEALAALAALILEIVESADNVIAFRA
jgi:integrase